VLKWFYKTKGAFENRKCRSLRMPKWLNCWQDNPISYAKKTFTKSMLQCRFRCMGLKRLQLQNESNFRYA
jgi:hypothetical protein